jgi:hypothetical protein
MSIKAIDERLKVITQLAQELVVHNKNIKTERIGGYIVRKGLLFTLDVSCSCYGYDENDKYHEEWAKEERKQISIIVAGNHSVFVNLIDTDFQVKLNLENFVNTSNHDSCWRSDGFSDVTWFFWKMYERVYSNMPEDKRPSMNNAHFFIWDVFNKIIQPVEIATEHGHGPGYNDKIIVMKNIPLKELV